MSGNPKVSYPDDTVECLLSPELFLLAVDRTVALAVAENQEPEDRATAVLFHLGLLCYIQGMYQAAADLTAEGKLMDSSITRLEREIRAVKNGQHRWELAESYCKDTLEITLNPIGMLVVLKRMAIDEESGGKNQTLSDAVDSVAKELEASARLEINRIVDASSQEGEVTMPEIKAPELIPQFFSMLEGIGTFQFDRNKYTTDEDRKKHDEIMAIYGKIIGA